MNPSSVDVKDMLEAESALALTFGTDLFIGSEPTSPDNCVTIYDTPGRAPHSGLNRTPAAASARTNAGKYFYPAVQVRVRNNAYVTGWGMAHDIKDALHNRAHETWGGSRYSLVVCSIEPHFLQWDENRRAVFVVNFDLQRTPT